MKKVGPIGVYETFIPGAKVGDLYKFYIIGYHGEELYKADNIEFIEISNLCSGYKCLIYPIGPTFFIGFACVFQLLNSPTTETDLAFGAHTAKYTPFLRLCIVGWAPNFL